jgi:tetrahydromethanopterin S-methyltransferase subunit E
MKLGVQAGTDTACYGKPPEATTAHESIISSAGRALASREFWNCVFRDLHLSHINMQGMKFAAILFMDGSGYILFSSRYLAFLPFFHPIPKPIFLFPLSIWHLA